MFFFQRSLLYHPSKEKLDTSSYSDTKLRKVEIATSDGLILKSFFKKPSSQEKNTVIVFHGNAGHIGHRVKKFNFFLEKGYGLLLVEYRGYGENLGKPTEIGLYRDGQAALEFLSKQKISKQKTILYGESLGCGLAVKFSTENEYKITILEAPYTSIPDIAKSHYWFLPTKWLVLDKFDIISLIKYIKSPLLVLHGENDKVINIKFGKKVFSLAPQPKEALFIPKAGHNNLYEYDIYKKIINFIEKY